MIRTMSHWTLLVRAGLFAAMIAAFPALLPAQAGGSLDPGRSYATRAGLEEMLARFNEAAGSAAYSGELRGRARQESALIRARLAEGDFRVGDRVALTVQNEPVFTDTFSVAQGRVLVLPLIGEIPLTGVLRSELEPHLRDWIGRSVRSPEVRAQSLLRIAVMGEVARPGFFVVPADLPLTDVLMAVGGTGRDANLRGIRVERAGERIWNGDAMRDALIEGRTLDQLSIRAGDEIVVPRVRRLTPWQAIQVVSAASSVIFALTRFF
jgi:protein involved in polysaccharide export with SLBB domain